MKIKIFTRANCDRQYKKCVWEGEVSYIPHPGMYVNFIDGNDEAEDESVESITYDVLKDIILVTLVTRDLSERYKEVK